MLISISVKETKNLLVSPKTRMYTMETKCRMTVAGIVESWGKTSNTVVGSNCFQFDSLFLAPPLYNFNCRVRPVCGFFLITEGHYQLILCEINYF